MLAVAYSPLYLAYAAALIAWFLATQLFPKLWPASANASFKHPWREFGYALLACIMIPLIGQLYMRGFKFSAPGALAPLAEAVNQIIIFSPIWILLWLRRQGLDTVWIPRSYVPQRLAVGLVLSQIALLVFATAKFRLADYPSLVVDVYRWGHFGLAVQVFLEDAAIALLMCRLAAAMRNPSLAAPAVGFLFAAGHVPTMISEGVALGGMMSLLFDFLLATFAIRALQRGRDIWWFWCVHFSIDMTQFFHSA